MAMLSQNGKSRRYFSNTEISIGLLDASKYIENYISEFMNGVTCFKNQKNYEDHLLE